MTHLSITQRATQRRSYPALRIKVVALAVASCFTAGVAQANPTNPVVTHGAASFTQSGNLLQIANSPNAIINWGSFSIGANEITRFIQQNSASAVLNRVGAGGDPSSILGALQSNGRVFLINPNGITFGVGSQINVAGLVASTLNLSDADFLAGRMRFTDGVGKNVINDGNIATGSSGSIYLVGNAVTNNGIITSPKGEVILAAGNSVELVNPGTPDLRVEITAPDNAARNLGQIVADSGRIGIYAGLINHSGTINANSVNVDAAGTITLRATTNIDLAATSRTSASGPKGGRIGMDAGSGAFLAGAIEAKGNSGLGGTLQVKSTATISNAAMDASGASGGNITLMSTLNYIGGGGIRADGTAGAGGNITITSNRVLQTSSEVISATGAGDRGGTIAVTGADRLVTSANIAATSSTHMGGDVRVLGNDVFLLGTSVNASGASGGSILVGGDLQGKNPNVLNAQTTSVNFSSILKADAAVSGDGGKIIVWSDNQTRYAGAASTRGGTQVGDGGFIEISGKETLAFGGTASAAAPSGRAGTLLLDPKNIIIDAAASGIGGFELVNPHPTAGAGFPGNVLVLGNNNVVATNPLATVVGPNDGAAYLYNGITGAIISAITGSGAGEGVGQNGAMAINSNNFLLVNPNWNSNTGAVTWGSGTTGFIGGSGVLSSTNSLVGASPGDQVGSGGITVHNITGNFAVTSPEWSNFSSTQAGAVTVGSGATGITGVVGTGNSLVGGGTGDRVGGGGFGTVQLGNADFLVLSPEWGSGGVANQGLGAATFVSGAGTTVGLVSSANSLVGSTAGDRVSQGPTLLTGSSGTYTIVSENWSNGRGAVTYSLSGTGISGAVSSANSLVGTSPGDKVGSGGIMVLNTGNQLIFSPEWTNGGTVTNAGAVTFVDTSAGITGLVTTPGNNSVWGTNTNDGIGAGGASSVMTLASASGNYVLRSPEWNGAMGAVTFVDKTIGFEIAGSTPGAISSANSLVGSVSGERVGSTAVGVNAVTPLNNGNYVVASPEWGNAGVSLDGKGAVTLVDGITGVPVGETTPGAVVSATNSLTGTQTGDQVGGGVFSVTSYSGLKALSNGNYVVLSPYWSNGGNSAAGAVTVVDGVTGVPSNETLPGVTVSPTNSLVGTHTGSFVGSNDIIELPTLGKFVINNANWRSAPITDSGAVTLMGNTPATAVIGVINNTNSLVGPSVDLVGQFVEAWGADKYIVRSPQWNGQRGAVTLVDATVPSTTVGTVSAVNSLVGGSAFDNVGSHSTVFLQGGSFLVRSPGWGSAGTPANALGAITYGSSTGTFSNGAAFAGTLSSTNSVVGAQTGDRVGTNGFGLGVNGVEQLLSGNFLVRSRNWINGAAASAGALTLGTSSGKFSDGVTPFAGVVSSSNSLVGSNANDRVGSGYALQLLDGANWNFIEVTNSWNSNAGAVTFGSSTGKFSDGVTPFAGTLSAANSLVGSAAGDNVGGGFVTYVSTAVPNWNFLVPSPSWNGNRGAITYGTSDGKFSDGSPFAGTLSSTNSLVGSTPSDFVGQFFVTGLQNNNFLVNTMTWNNGGGAANAGAVTFGTLNGKLADGITPFAGTISASNSLVGTQAGDLVGNEVVVLNNGSYAVVSSNWSNGAITNVGAVTLGSGTSGIVGTISAANSLIGSVAGDQFGSGFGSVTAFLADSALVRSVNAENASQPTAGRLHVLSPGAAGALPPMGFADNAAGTSTISPSQITAITNTGTAVVLQANNDITQLAGANIVTGAGGAGGAITMQAGRSILLNANIVTDNGNLTLVANENAASGVQDAHRDVGAAAITMAAGATLNAGSGTISITMNDGAGITNAQSGNITLANLNTSGRVVVEDRGASIGNFITQLAGSAITAGELQVVGGISGVILDSVTNAVTTVAGSSGGNFVFRNDGSFAVGNVGGVNGIQAQQNVDLASINGSMTINAPLNGVAGDVSVSAGAAGAVYIASDISSAAGILANSGSGVVTFTGAATVSGGSGTFDVGTLNVGPGGAPTLNISTQVTNDVNVTGGTLTLGADLTVGGNMTVSGSSQITGSGNIDMVALTGTFNWSGGTIDGIGTLTTAAPGTGVTSNITGTVTLARDWFMNGPGNIDLGGSLNISAGSALNIANTSTLNILSTSTALSPIGGTGTVFVNGTLNEQRLTPVDISTVTLNNNAGGIVSNVFGNLLIGPGNDAAASTYATGASGFMIAANGTHTSNGGSFTGSGFIQTNGGNWSFANATNATIPATMRIAVNTGNMLLDAGPLTVAALEVHPGGTLTGSANISTGNLLWAGGAIGGSGTLTTSGAGSVGVSGPVVLQRDWNANSGVSISGAGQVDIGAGNTLTVTVPGQLNITSPSGTVISGAGTLSLLEGQLNVNSAGAVAVAPAVFDTGQQTGPSSINIASGTLKVGSTTGSDFGTTYSGAGSVEFFQGTRNLTNSGIFDSQIQIGGPVNFTGANVTFGSSAIYNPGGATTVSAGSVTFNMPALTLNTPTNLAGGAINAAGNITNNSTITLGAGTLLNAPGQTIAISSTGMLKGTGTIVGNVSNSGTVAPGASPGIMVITGNYTQTSTGVLQIEIGGTTPGTGYDQLQVSGNANLDGTMVVTQFGIFVPTSLNTFQPIVTSSGSVTGVFSSVVVQPVLTGLGATYLAQSVDLGGALGTAVVVVDPRIVNENKDIFAQVNEDKDIFRKLDTQVCD